MTDINLKHAEEMIEEIHSILIDSFNQKEEPAWEGKNNAVRLYRLHFIKMYVDKMIYGTSNKEVEKMFADWNIPMLINKERPDEWEE